MAATSTTSRTRVSKPKPPTPLQLGQLVESAYQDTLPHCHHPMGVEGVGRMIKRLLQVVAEHPEALPTIRAALDATYPNSVV